MKVTIIVRVEETDNTNMNETHYLGREVMSLEIADSAMISDRALGSLAVSCFDKARHNMRNIEMLANAGISYPEGYHLDS
jgi:hypothetical protein